MIGLPLRPWAAGRESTAPDVIVCFDLLEGIDEPRCSNDGPSEEIASRWRRGRARAVVLAHRPARPRASPGKIRSSQLPLLGPRRSRPPEPTRRASATGRLRSRWRTVLRLALIAPSSGLRIRPPLPSPLPPWSPTSVRSVLLLPGVPSLPSLPQRGSCRFFCHRPRAPDRLFSQPIRSAPPPSAACVPAPPGPWGEPGRSPFHSGSA